MRPHVRTETFETFDEVKARIDATAKQQLADEVANLEVSNDDSLERDAVEAERKLAEAKEQVRLCRLRIAKKSEQEPVQEPGLPITDDDLAEFDKSFAA